VPGVQAISTVGIVIGIARFWTVPDAMIVIVLQLIDGPCVERLSGRPFQHPGRRRFMA
jgi:hypothetical protein